MAWTVAMAGCKTGPGRTPAFSLFSQVVATLGGDIDLYRPHAGPGGRISWAATARLCAGRHSSDEAQRYPTHKEMKPRGARKRDGFSFSSCFWDFGGAEGDRTPDLVIANDALSQLSYGPNVGCYLAFPGRGVKRESGPVGIPGDRAAAGGRDARWTARQRRFSTPLPRRAQAMTLDFWRTNCSIALAGTAPDWRATSRPFW